MDRDPVDAQAVPEFTNNSRSPSMMAFAGGEPDQAGGGRMCQGISSYYDLFSALVAERYLQKLDAALDHWEVHFLRRGYDFLRRGIAEGAISALNYLDLPPERRAAVFTGPMPVTPLTGCEAEEIRRGLGHVIAMEEKRIVVSAPSEAASARMPMARFG